MSPPLQRGSLWLDVELFLLDDVVDADLGIHDTISRGLSISTTGEILAVLELAGEPPEVVVLQPIPSPGWVALCAAACLCAVRRKR